VRLRVIHAVRMKQAGSAKEFVIEPQNCGSDEDDMLTKSKQRDVCASDKGPIGGDWERLAGGQDHGTR
jgi:hypothetical protein